MPAPHPEIQMVESAGAHSDQNFVRIDGRLAYFGVIQDIGTAVLSKKNRFHEFLPQNIKLRLENNTSAVGLCRVA